MYKRQALGHPAVDGAAGADIVFGDNGLVGYVDFDTSKTDFNFPGSRIRLLGGDQLIGDSNESLIGGYAADGIPTSMDLIVAQPLGSDGSDTIIGGDGKVQLCLSGNGGAGEVNINGPIMTPNQWYHMAFTYKAATNEAGFFVDGVSSGKANPNWGGNSTQNDWWIGAWPSNGANRGMAGWIDAVCLSDAVLTPSTFNLPRDGYSTIQNWEMY